MTKRIITDNENRTLVTIFEFTGLSTNEKLAPILFVFFLLVYMVTVVGNLGMISLVYASCGLHTPMYYFLSSLSSADLLCSSVLTPNTLSQFLSQKKTISFLGCTLQFYLFSALASTATLLLSTMSYDRYVAICHPLHYTVIMTRRKCFGLILSCYSFSFLPSAVQTSCVFTLPFCGPNLVDHFFCDILPLLKLSCSNPAHCNMITAILVAVYGIYSITTLALSYTFIFLAIFRMSSTKGRQKAFSTCSSHIICVSTFFTAVFFVYLRPSSGVFQVQDKVASVVYTILMPMLNPLIYSLRNQDVKQILVQALHKC